MNSRFLFGSVLLPLLFVSSLAVAQEPRTLTEQDVVTAAVMNNPTLHVALLRAQQSRYNVSAEQALYTPIFDASAGYTHTRTPSLFGPTFDMNGVQTSPPTTRQ